MINDRYVLDEHSKSLLKLYVGSHDLFYYNRKIVSILCGEIMVTIINEITKDFEQITWESFNDYFIFHGGSIHLSLSQSIEFLILSEFKKLKDK